MNKGQTGFEQLKKLSVPSRLRSEMDKLNYTKKTGKAGAYEATSCAQTNVVVVKTLAGQRIPSNSESAAQMAGLTSVVSWTPADINAALDSDKIVVFELKFTKTTGGVAAGSGDHYFSAFKLDAARVVVSMGWQGLYDFSQWFEENDGGRFKRVVFDGLAEKIHRKDIKGVGDLCAFLGLTKQGRSILQGLDQEIGYMEVAAKVYTVPLAG